MLKEGGRGGTGGEKKWENLCEASSSSPTEGGIRSPPLQFRFSRSRPSSEPTKARFQRRNVKKIIIKKEEREREGGFRFLGIQSTVPITSPAPLLSFFFYLSFYQYFCLSNSALPLSVAPGSSRGPWSCKTVTTGRRVAFYDDPRDTVADAALPCPGNQLNLKKSRRNKTGRRKKRRRGVGTLNRPRTQPEGLGFLRLWWPWPSLNVFTVFILYF